MYFGNSVPKIYSTHEDHKPVSICVHDCQIPIYFHFFQYIVFNCSLFHVGIFKVKASLWALSIGVHMGASIEKQHLYGKTF